MTINPGIFKAYDIRGLYPSEPNEEVARQIGRAYAAYLQPNVVGVLPVARSHGCLKAPEPVDCTR
jgi:phosphomannomutase